MSESMIELGPNTIWPPPETPEVPDDWDRLNDYRLTKRSLPSIIVSAQWLLSQELWLPIYEEGGPAAILEMHPVRPRDFGRRVRG